MEGKGCFIFGLCTSYARQPLCRAYTHDRARAPPLSYTLLVTQARVPALITKITT